MSSKLFRTAWYSLLDPLQSLMDLYPRYNNPARVAKSPKEPKVGWKETGVIGERSKCEGFQPVRTPPNSMSHADRNIELLYVRPEWRFRVQVVSCASLQEYLMRVARLRQTVTRSNLVLRRRHRILYVKSFIWNPFTVNDHAGVVAKVNLGMGGGKGMIVETL